MEVIWTIIPFIIVIVMALPATKVLVASKDTGNADVTIKATGYQWKWGYDYLSGDAQGVSFLSNLDSTHREMSNDGGQRPRSHDYLLKVDNPMVVPVNKKVRIITTANDVIHAWGMPAFGVKQDAIPGFVRDTWFRSEKVGDFYGQCYELCGKEHAYMPIHVKVVSQEEFVKWSGDQKLMAAKAGRPVQGLEAGRHRRPRREDLCAELRGLPPAQRQGRRPDQGAGRIGHRARCRQEQGNPGGAQRPRADAARGSSSRHTDLAAVISYTKNAWTNKTGQVVQPAEVLAQRGK